MSSRLTIARVRKYVSLSIFFLTKLPTKIHPLSINAIFADFLPWRLPFCHKKPVGTIHAKRQMSNELWNRLCA